MATGQFALCRHEDRYEKSDSQSRTYAHTYSALTDGQHNVALEEIIINGKRRQKAYLRGLAISRELPAGIVIPYNKREVLNYAQVIPYEPWMANAS